MTDADKILFFLIAYYMNSKKAKEFKMTQRQFAESPEFFGEDKEGSIALLATELAKEIRNLMLESYGEKECPSERELDTEIRNVLTAGIIGKGE